jgi:hypothetical protein
LLKHYYLSCLFEIFLFKSYEVGGWVLMNLRDTRRDKSGKGFQKTHYCMNCSKEIPADQINDMYSARFCSEKCKKEYLNG